MAEAKSKQDVVLTWLPSGRKAKLADFAQGEAFGDLASALTRAVEAKPKGTLPWICCDKKFVMAPEDISMAHAQLKEGG